MAFSKAVVTGIVYRAPEKRFTQNNIAVSGFVLNVGEREETLVRVLSRRQALDVKTDEGTERKIYEIDANTIEKMGEGSATSSNEKFGTEEIVKFESDDMSNELINEDEIPF